MKTYQSTDRVIRAFSREHAASIVLGGKPREYRAVLLKPEYAGDLRSFDVLDRVTGDWLHVMDIVSE